MRAQNFRSECSPTVDRDLIIPFNNKVKSMLNALNRNLPKAKFIYMDIYKMISDILANPRSYGICLFFTFIIISVFLTGAK
jgi:phospholipase/lecithinase/hemolysin